MFLNYEGGNNLFVHHLPLLSIAPPSCCLSPESRNLTLEEFRFCLG